jgi:predicted nucleic acid-binding protein
VITTSGYFTGESGRSTDTHNGDKVLQRKAWKVADQLGWETTYDAEFVALTQLQGDGFVTSDGDLARAASRLVETATIDACVRLHVFDNNARASIDRVRGQTHHGARVCG